MSKDFDDILKKIQISGSPSGQNSSKKDSTSNITVGKAKTITESLHSQETIDTVNGLMPDKKKK